MSASVATAAFPTVVTRGDGGVGAGTQASKTIGTSAQLLTVGARTAGAAGNSKTFGIVVAAGTVTYSQVITANSVLINSATTSGTATTKVATAMSNLIADNTFAANFFCSTTGDGSGVLVAGASAALTSGTDGAEVFASLAEIRNITGPTRQQTIIEVTNMDSVGNYREYISSFLDAGAVAFDMNFTNVTSQQALISDLENRVLRNFKLAFTTKAGTVTYAFAALVTKFENSFQMANQLLANVEFKVSGGITVS